MTKMMRPTKVTIGPPSIEASPLKKLQANPAYLQSLTANERDQEAGLTREVSQLYATFKPRSPLADRFITTILPGGFDKSWTHAGGSPHP